MPNYQHSIFLLYCFQKSFTFLINSHHLLFVQIQHKVEYSNSAKTYKISRSSQQGHSSPCKDKQFSQSPQNKATPSARQDFCLINYAEFSDRHSSQQISGSNYKCLAVERKRSIEENFKGKKEHFKNKIERLQRSTKMFYLYSFRRVFQVILMTSCQHETVIIKVNEIEKVYDSSIGNWK